MRRAANSAPSGSRILGVLEIDKAILELLIGDGVYRGHDRADARSTTREPGRESDQHARMMPSSRQVLGRDVSEVSNVLGEHGIAVRDCRRKDLEIRPSGQPELDHGTSIHTRGTQRLCERSRVHLIQQQPQFVSAAAVSRRCNSMRAAISSG